MCAVEKALVLHRLHHGTEMLCVFLDSISNRTKSKRKSIQTKRDKGKPFLNQYRRKNTNQGQNKRLKQKTIKKTHKK